MPLPGPGQPQAGADAGFPSGTVPPARPGTSGRPSDRLGHLDRLSPQVRFHGLGRVDGLDRPARLGGHPSPDRPGQDWDTWEEWLTWQPGESPRPRRTSVPEPDAGRPEDTRPPAPRDRPAEAPGPPRSAAPADREAADGKEHDRKRGKREGRQDRKRDPERARGRGGDQGVGETTKREDTVIDTVRPHRPSPPEANRRPAVPPSSSRFPHTRPRSSEQAIGRHNLYEPDSARPGGADEEERVADQPSGQVLPVLPLGAGMTLVGLGLGFLALRMRRS